ncbi:MAG: hypothetical protein J5584_04825 [Clostridia bacterium]|nr:hypothetical protein [Clostridia bacterium]
MAMEQDVQSLDLLDMLESMINSAKKTMFNNKASIDRDEALGIIDELRNSLPEETVRANDFYKRSREVWSQANDNADDIMAKAKGDAGDIIADAQKEADGIVADAHNQAEVILQDAGQRRLQLIEENSITEAAKARAEEIIAEANARAKEIRHGTREYVDNTLLGLSEFLAKTYNEVEANRKSM